jgi:hypothetical protein
MTATRQAETAPLPPDSAKGREVTENLSQVFAEVRLAIAERKRQAERRSTAA